MGNTLYRWVWDYVDFIFRMIFDSSAPAVIVTGAVFAAAIGLMVFRFRSR